MIMEKIWQLKFKGEGKYKRLFYTLEALVNDLEKGKRKQNILIGYV
jgi:hypothetical protein